MPPSAIGCANSFGLGRGRVNTGRSIAYARQLPERSIAGAAPRAPENVAMFPGPVIISELVTTARRKRAYALRFFYGLILLLLIWEYCFRTFTNVSGNLRVTLTINQMSDLALRIFETFAITQAVVLMFLTPALVAGSIAEERQRKTLDYLLASRLSSAEIVLGKLSARLVQVGVLVTLGVPIQCMLSLFGGIPFDLIVLVYAGTCSTVLFLAAVSVAVSSYSRRPRDAIALVYVLTIVWLFVPTLIATLMPSGGSPWIQIYDWIRPANEWFGATSPFHIMATGYYTSRGPNGPLQGTAWMIGLQLAWGLALVLWSIARLRPIFRKAGEPVRWLRWSTRTSPKKRFLPRPPCGDDAMLWKERHVTRMSRGGKIVGSLIVLCLGALLAYTTFTTAGPAFLELADNGFASFGSTETYQDRATFNLYLRVVGALIYLAWMLGVTSAAATSITSEREADTWTSLIAAPLEGSEILRAKMIGAVWSTRSLGALMLALGLIGIAAGSVHPFGLLVVILETLVFVWFAAALGTFVSLRAQTSMRAMTATIGILIVANGGYLMCCIPFASNSLVTLAGVTPLVEVISLLNYREFEELIHGKSFARSFFSDPDMLLTCVFSTLIYSVGAFTLTALSVAGFDDEIDRPRQDSTNPAGPLVRVEEGEEGG